MIIKDFFFFLGPPSEPGLKQFPGKTAFRIAFEHDHYYAHRNFIYR